MRTITSIIPLLTLVLLIPPGLINAQTTPGGEDFTDDVGAVGNTGAYIEALKLDESYQNMTSTQQEAYINSANEFISSGDAYELARNKLLIQASEITVQIHLTNDEQRLDELKIQYDNVLVQLEEFGVGPQDKTVEDPSYYFDKYDQKLREYEDQGYANVNDVHTSDISLSNQAGILFPCAPGPFN